MEQDVKSKRYLGIEKVLTNSQVGRRKERKKFCETLSKS